MDGQLGYRRGCPLSEKWAIALLDDEEDYWGDSSHTHFHGTTRCLICGMQMELPSSFVLNGVTCTDCRLRQKRVVEEWESENELTDPNQ